MYKPKLNYVFCLMRKRSLMPAMSVMRYMNSVGLVPQLLINGVEFGKNQHSLIIKELNRYNIRYDEVKISSNHDVMFVESPGNCPFETRWLTESKKHGKTNIVLVNNTSAYRNVINPYILPEKTKLIDGVCLRIEETLLSYREVVKNLFLVNVGDPDWDWWQTDEFKGRVEDITSEFGNNILIVCENFVLLKDSTSYTEFCIKRAESLGFKVIVSTHPDVWERVPKQFHKYCDTSTSHHVLLKAASHVISNVNSSIIAETLFLGTRIGCNPAGFHCEKWGQSEWLDKNSWFVKMSKHVKQEILDIVFPVFDAKDLDDFLSSSESKVSIELVEKLFGRIVVPCYSEYLFKVIEEKLAG